MAVRLGIVDWVRVERADPADLASWEGLRQAPRAGRSPTRPEVQIVLESPLTSADGGVAPLNGSPASTIRIPLLVGTASFVPELGYTVPPGTWNLTVPVHLDDHRRLIPPPIEFTVVPDLPGGDV